MKKLTKEEIERIYRERIDAESLRPETEEEKAGAKRNYEEAMKYAKKMREEQGLDY